MRAFPDSSTSLRVEWLPPPEEKRNGRITYYKIFHVPSARPDSDAAVVEVPAREDEGDKPNEFILDELREWAEYRVWVLAGTQIGDGPASQHVTVKTDESGA